MHVKDLIKSTIDLSAHVVNQYTSDLADADLLVRPVPGMNHIAWQIGHLIASERFFVEAIRPGSSPPLPEDFEQGHGRKATDVDDPSKYYTVARYRDLWDAQRAATRSVIDGLPEEEFDRVEPRLPAFAPTVGAALNLCGTHPLMHVGQFVAVRRALGKPITI